MKRCPICWMRQAAPESDWCRDCTRAFDRRMRDVGQWEWDGIVAIWAARRARAAERKRGGG